jgi:two-component system, chemotaxis family, CheB/CheR fusion protein
VDTKKNILNKQNSSEIKVAEFSIVGIGASAGGLEPITKLLGNLPIQTGLSFVVIQHLAAGQESMLPEILSRSTKMKVQQATNNMQIEQDHVYVIAPGTTLTLKDGRIKLLPKKPAFKPINDFFVSLASEKKTWAVGIVLSGTGNDGTEGLKAIKAEGGITFAQEPDTAQYPDMPKNAIAAGPPDFVLSPEQIAKELVRIAKFPQLIRSEAKEPEHEKVETDFKKIIMLLKTSFGVDFTHYRETTINRRITRRMVINKTENMNEYVVYLRAHPSEQQSLFDDLLIGVTSFFREPKTFLALKEKVFPELVQNKSFNESIRVWVPGCSTGEEVYSFAIAIKEFLEERDLTEIRVQIFGTDANEKNIEKARQGTYPKSIEDKVSSNRLKRFFTSENGHCRIAKFLRDMCIFAKQDITTDPPFSNVDLIICRNVLIYFDSYLHDRVLPIFHYGLKSNGFLVLGESESVGKFQYLFASVTPKGLIYRKKQAQPQASLGETTFTPYAANKTVKQPEKVNLLAVLGEKVDHLIKTEYGPATLLVNNNLDILVFRGDVASFLSPESGAASLNVTKIIRKELRSQVQTAVYRAKKESEVFKETVRFKQKGDPRTVHIEVRPLKTSEFDEPFYLVLFTEATSQETSLTKETESAVSSVEMESLKDRQIRELGEDLEATKASLQTLVEGQEATTEELRSSMEEVQSSNEELQSTNEELETAKEELQSGNEELQTLNEELKNRNQTLGRLNDDLVNLQMNIDSSVVIVDNDFKIRRFTVSAQSLLKISPSEIGHPISSINSVINRMELEKAIKDVITKLTPVSREVECAEDRLCEMRVRPYLTDEKKIDGAVLSFTDITEDKKTQEGLRKQASLIDLSPDAIFRKKLDDTIIFWSQGAQSLYGWTKDEALGQKSRELLKTKFSEPYKEILSQLECNGRWSGEKIHTTKSGDQVVVDSRWLATCDVKGKIEEILETNMDITKRKELQTKLEEHSKNLESLVEERTKKLEVSNRKLSEILDGMQEFFYVLDRHWNFVYANKQITAASGKDDPADWVGKNYWNMFPKYIGTSTEREFHVAMEQRVIRRFESQGQYSDTWFWVTVFPSAEGISVLGTNITERKKLEKQLQDQERLAAIGTTAAMVGHDIRNPLQAIISDVYLAKAELASTPESEEKKCALESLREIEKNIDYINKIVADLQDFARPLSPHTEVTDLKLIIDDLLSKNSWPENIKISVKVEPAVSKVIADSAYINRIMYNLVNNAVQSMPNGGKLALQVCKDANDVIITVMDNGVGIPEAVKNKLFTPMFTTKAKGQGFGLPVIKRMTEALGGTVSFESQEGKGTTFIIRLPQPKKL